MYKIIEITTPTCSVCKMIKPMVEKVISSFPNVELTVVDHEEETAQRFLTQYNIKSVPIFFFMKEDEVFDVHFGAIGLPVLKSKIESLINEG
jgi:thiol-disulfide isomerase/thioredoxin